MIYYLPDMVQNHSGNCVAFDVYSLGLGNCISHVRDPLGMLCLRVCLTVQRLTLKINANCTPVDVLALSILALDKLLIYMTCTDLQASQHEERSQAGQCDQVLRSGASLLVARCTRPALMCVLQSQTSSEGAPKAERGSRRSAT